VVPEGTNLGRPPEVHGDLGTDTSLTTGHFDTATFTTTAATWQQTFSYDPFGNTSKSGSSAFAATYSTATNQFTVNGVTVTYDRNGNLLTDNLSNTYTWDPNWGNPASINGTNLIYDALGRMVEQQTGSSYTQMLYSQAGKTALMNGQSLQKAFVYLPGGGTAIYNSSGVLSYYRHSDWLGSSRLTSTASQTVYSYTAYAPFGEQYVPSGTADASFTGQNSDTTSSLYDFRFREHSPTQGRWISPDPAGLGAVDRTNPQTWNRYAYVANNPLSFVDPLGLQLKGPCGAANNCPGSSVDEGAIYPGGGTILWPLFADGGEAGTVLIGWLPLSLNTQSDYLNYLMQWVMGRTIPNPQYILKRTYDCFAPGDGFRSSNHTLEGPPGVDTSNAVITEHLSNPDNSAPNPQPGIGVFEDQIGTLGLTATGSNLRYFTVANNGQNLGLIAISYESGPHTQSKASGTTSTFNIRRMIRCL
jgi:RHS repeat-associated protein